MAIGLGLRLDRVSHCGGCLVSPDARKGWDVLTITAEPVEFRILGEERRSPTAIPAARLCMIELLADVPTIWWHLAGETQYRRVEVSWLLQMPDELRKFSPVAISIIAGTGMAYDAVSNAKEIILERIASTATPASTGAH